VNPHLEVSAAVVYQELFADFDVGNRLDRHSLLARGWIEVGPELCVGSGAGAVVVVQEASLVAGARGVNVDIYLHEKVLKRDRLFSDRSIYIDRCICI